MTRRAIAMRLLRAAEKAYGDRLPYNHRNGLPEPYEFGTQDSLARFIAVETYELATDMHPEDHITTTDAVECAEDAIRGVDTAIKELEKVRDAMTGVLERLHGGQPVNAPI